MELFKLFGTIAVDNATAKQAIKDTSDEASGAESVMSSAFENIGSFAVKCGQVIATGLAVGATAITALAKSSLDSYGEYEQLVGGVETLFGAGGKSLEEYAASVGKTVDEVSAEYEMLMNRQSTVFQNAENAYMTAGMSANEYMSTVTSFSASLIQSLGDNAASAAIIADKAITDMSDNANKMGTSMESIQNAYQGFAKQNYTMLDNLKLGYGGTKEEMERLLADAEKLGGFAEGTFSTDSFADIIEAIHLVQTEIGITGTTSSEASETIQGSAASMGAAWKNLVIGLGDESKDVGVLIDTLATSATTSMDNMLPRLEKILLGIADAIVNIVPVIAEKLPEMLETLIPALIEGATTLIGSLAEALPDLFELIKEQTPALIDAVLVIIDELLNSIVEAFPDFLDTVITIVEKLVEALPDLLTTILEALPEVLPQLIDAIVEIMLLLVNNFSTIIQPIIDNLPTIITTLVTALTDNLPVIIEGLVTLIVEIVKALPDIMMALYEALPTIIPEIIDCLWEALPLLIEGLREILEELLESIGKSVVGVGSILSEAFSAGYEKIKEIFNPVGEYFSGIWEDIKDAFGKVSEWFEETFSDAWEKVLGVFSKAGTVFEGIKEGISDVFTTVVNHLIDGINEVIAKPFNTINEILNGIRGIKVANMKPFSKLWDEDPLEVPELPKLYEGGVLEKGQVGLLEGDGAEAVVPLHNNKKWISKVADDFEGELGNNDAVVKKLDELIKAILNLKLYMNNDVLVGELVPAMDASLGNMYVMKGRGQ